MNNTGGIDPYTGQILMMPYDDVGAVAGMPSSCELIPTDETVRYCNAL